MESVRCYRPSLYWLRAYCSRHSGELPPCGLARIQEVDTLFVVAVFGGPSCKTAFFGERMHSSLRRLHLRPKECTNRIDAEVVFSREIARAVED